MKTMQVQINDAAGIPQMVDVQVVKENARTVWVKLPDGNIIKRHKVKHNYR